MPTNIFLEVIGTAYEIRRKMEEELDNIKLKIAQCDNKLKYAYKIGSHEYYHALEELERLIKRKTELEDALRLIGQFER